MKNTFKLRHQYINNSMVMLNLSGDPHDRCLPVFRPLRNPLPLSVGRSCDLLLDSKCSRSDGMSSLWFYDVLYKTVLLADSLLLSFWPCISWLLWHELCVYGEITQQVTRL